MITAKRKARFFIDRDMISEHLNCPICLEVMDNPMRTRCGHTFCLYCIEDWISTNQRSKYCPVCKKGIHSGKDLEKDIIPGKIIDDLKVKCINRDCRWVGRNANLKHHRATCEHRVRPVVVEPKNIITIEEDMSLAVQKRNQELVCCYKEIVHLKP